MSVVPFTWPVGMGKSFAGVIDIINHQMRLFKAGEDRVTEDSNTILALDDPSLKDRFGDAFEEALAEVDLVKNAMPAFDRNEFLAGRQSPVFFGSAINNFGVREMLQRQARAIQFNARSNRMRKNVQQWSLRFRRIWTQRTVIASPSYGFARVTFSAA